MVDPQPEPVARDDRSKVDDLRAALLVMFGLAAFGALLGWVWALWSGPQQRAYVLAPGQLYPFDEVETMAAADGRYLVITLATGLLAAVLLWFLRPVNRGPAILLGLCAGSLAGSALTAWVGHLSGGGTFNGKPETTIAHLPLSLHLRGLLFIQSAAAALVYGMLVAFTARDDLGRADPVRERLSVRSAPDAYDGGGDGDAARAPQQRDLPPQQSDETYQPFGRSSVAE